MKTINPNHQENHQENCICGDHCKSCKTCQRWQCQCLCYFQEEKTNQTLSKGKKEEREIDYWCP